MMYFQIGAFKFEPGEARLQSYSQRQVGTRRGFFKVVHQMSIEVEVVRSSQAAISARINEITAALNQARFARGAGFVEDSGRYSALTMYTAESLTGLQVESLTFPAGDAANYATYAPLSFTLTAEFPNPNGAQLVDYSESVTVQGGGGPRVEWVEVFEGPPQPYRLADQTKVIVTQTGQAIGLSAYPVVNAPIFPDYEISEARAIKTDSPEYDSRSFTNYPISWGYTFIMPTNPGGIPPLAR